MAALAIALPILPGKTEAWRRVIQEVTGPRRKENEAFHQRVGVTKAQ